MITAGFFFLLGGVAGALVAWWLGHGAHPERAAEEQSTQAAQAAAQATAQANLQSHLEAMRQQVESYQARIVEFEKERAGAQARIQEQLAAVAGAGTAMAQEARALREALATNSGVRGDWGEAVLQNILNACGLHQQIDYDLQVELEGRLRPDAVIYLPSGRKLAVDAKASLAAFLDGLQAPDEATRQARYAEFAQVLRRRAKELAGKEYSRSLENSLPCVAMFVPSEGAFRAALDADPELFRYGQSLQPPVLLASPSTLFPLILVVAHGWQQHKAGEQMRELLAEVAEFGRRLTTFLGHVQGLGKALDAAGKAYNAALSSYRARLAPQEARLRELNAGWAAPAEIPPVENHPLLGDDAQ